MAESYSNALKTLREMEKLLVMSNFSFSHSVFNRHVIQKRKSQGLFGKGLIFSKNEPRVFIQIVDGAFSHYGQGKYVLRVCNNYAKYAPVPTVDDR